MLMGSSLAFGQTSFFKYLLFGGMNANGQLLGLQLTVCLNISYSIGYILMDSSLAFGQTNISYSMG